MDLDRQIMMAVGAAVFAMLLIGTTILYPSTSSTDPVDVSSRPLYSKDDIRFPMQQAELKEAKKHPKKKAAPTKSGKEQFATDGSTSSGGGGGDSSGDDESSGDDPNEEPSVTDHEPQEEPPNNGE